MPPARSKLASSLVDAVDEEAEEAPDPAVPPGLVVLEREDQETVKVELTNLDENRTLAAGHHAFRIVDRERVPHTVETDELADREGSFPERVDLDPGESAEGWLVFSTPLGPEPLRLRFDGTETDTTTRLGSG